ncbi:MAG: diadenylate cyclase [Verrucomicrobiales bacterium]
MSLKSIAETGVGLDSKFSPELIQTIFVPKSPLHDGGVILSQSRVAAAGCVFPVSQREMPDRSLGLRHRAGIGITEETDALVIIVSEETGAVSIANAGKLEKDLSHTEFRQRLASHLFGALDEPGDPGEKEAPAPKKPTKPSHEKSAAQSVEG